jgi:NADH:ubiquinone oxidoreductase subunit 6 (subunit J)
MDRILFILVLVEILHTVRISIRSHTLVIEPFLIVGLIAIVRRMLVLTLQAENFVNPEHLDTGGQEIFHSYMLQLGMLAVLIVVFVVSIYIIRRSQPPDEPDSGSLFR